MYKFKHSWVLCTGIPVAVASAMYASLFVPALQVYALDGTFTAIQMNDSLDLETYRQSYGLAYSQSDVLEESVTVRLAASFSDDFLPGELVLGDWEGYDGEFTVSGYLDDQKVMEETVDEGSTLDLSVFPAVDQIEIMSVGEVTGTASFSDTEIRGDIDKSFHDETLFGHFYYYVSDPSGGSDGYIQVGSHTAEMDGIHFDVGKPSASISSEKIPFGESASLSATGLSLHADGGLNYFRAYIYLPAGSHVTDVTLPVFDHASAQLFVDGKPVNATDGAEDTGSIGGTEGTGDGIPDQETTESSGTEGETDTPVGTVTVNAQPSEMYVEIKPDSQDVLQTGDLLVNFTNASGAGITGEAYVKAVANFGDNASKYEESNHLTVTFLPDETAIPDDPGTDTPVPDDPAEEDPEPDDPDIRPGDGGDTSDPTPGGSSGTPGTEDPVAGVVENTKPPIEEAVIVDMTGLGLGQGTLHVTAGLADTSIASIANHTTRTGSSRAFQMNQAETVAIEDVNEEDLVTRDVEGGMGRFFSEDELNGSTDHDRDDAEPTTENREEERETLFGFFRENLFKIMAGCAAGVIIVVIAVICIRHRSNKFYD